MNEEYRDALTLAISRMNFGINTMRQVCTAEGTRYNRSARRALLGLLALQEKELKGLLALAGLDGE